MAKVEMYGSGGNVVLRPGEKRRFLFLQGIASPFFSSLGSHLRRQGCDVHKIHLSAADQIFWKGRATAYRGPLRRWVDHLRDYISHHGITDICLFGTTRPYHRPAMEIAKNKSIPVHVFEEGYIRPNWITVDRDGANAESSFPRVRSTLDPAARASRDGSVHADHSGDRSRGRTSMFYRTIWDIAMHTANIVGAPAFPYYRHHRPDPIYAEAFGWVKRVTLKPLERPRTQYDLERITNTPGGYFLVPLQLNSDVQIRVYSPFGRVEAFLEEVIASFAAHAPVSSALLIKSHPLHNGLVDWRKLSLKLATRYGVGDRLGFADFGNTNALLKGARGVVVVNSTTGLTAVQSGIPTIALGTSLYDQQGITHASGLRSFWTDPTPPDPQIVSNYVDAIVDQTQISGSYFVPSSIEATAKRAAKRVLENAAFTSANVDLPRPDLEAFKVAAE